MLTVAEARSQIASAAGLCANDARVLGYLNRAVRRLLPKGKWRGSYQSYRICANADCITWPRQIATIEAAAICSRPITVRNQWYEFLESGPGISSCGSSAQLIDRGDQHCSFADITTGATDRKIRVYADIPQTGKYIILQGYDENANWIRTSVSGTYIDGERVAIPTTSTPTITTQYFSRLTRVIKDATYGAVRLYEYNTTTAANVRALAMYEPDETLPSYRRSYVPGLSETNSSSECESAAVDVMAKLRFYKVANENDFLLIANLDALEEETRALCHFDNKNLPEAYACEASAVKLLQEELSHFLGDGPVVQMRVQAHSFGAGEVENAI